MTEPFDPFSYDEEDYDEPSKAATDGTSKTTNTTNKRRQQQPIGQGEGEQALSLEELPLQLSSSFSANKRLPPRLNVKLSYHEEVSSNSIEEKGKSLGGSLSRLFVTGKIMAQVESTDSNQNAPFCLSLSGPMISIAKVKCHQHCIPITSMKDANNNKDSTHNKNTKSFKILLPKSLEQTHVATYSIENVETQNMPILLQTKATIHNTNCRIGIQIRSNLSNLGDLHDFIIVLSLPTTVKAHTVKITRGMNGEMDEMKGIVTWKIGHLAHGKSNLVSIEAEMNEKLIDMMESMGAEHVQEMIEFPVLVRCCSGMDQISDVVLSCRSLEEAPASISVQIVKSFRLIHRVCKGDI